MSKEHPSEGNSLLELGSSESNPPNLVYKSGDLLTAKEEYVVHQCNCVTIRPAGLAAAITSKFPYAAPYANRRPDPSHRSRCLPADMAKPGTIQVWRSPSPETPHFIGLYAQEGPGNSSGEDSRSAREGWFRQCLELVAEVDGLKSIALPWQIGCGLAGGDWEVYQKIIKEWAEKHEDIQIVIYKLEDVKASGGRGRGRGRGRDRGWSRS